MSKMAAYGVLALGALGVVYNVTTLSIPLISDAGDVVLGGIAAVLGLWGYVNA